MDGRRSDCLAGLSAQLNVLVPLLLLFFPLNILFCRCRPMLVCLRFQVLTAASVKVAIFWDIAPSSLVEIDRRFRGAYCLHRQGDQACVGYKQK
jgi:hypothetical protein